MKNIPGTPVEHHSEFHPTRQVLFSVISCVLNRFEPLLRRGINHTLEVERNTLSIPDLPEKLHGTRVVHISDMHFHEKWQPIDMALALVKKLELIKQEAGENKVVCVFTGDIVSKHTHFEAVKSALSGFMHAFHQLFGSEAQLYACEGNHDILRPHWETEKAYLERHGFDYSGEWNKDGIHIVATPDSTVDPDGARIGVVNAMNTKTDNTFLRLILSHNLAVMTGLEIPEDTITQLIMSGHAHSGHVGLVSDPSFSDTSDYVRCLMSRILLGYDHPLVSGVQRLDKKKNVFASVSPGAGENEKRPRLNSSRGLSVFTLMPKNVS